MLEQAKNIIIKGDPFKERTTFELFSQRRIVTTYDIGI